MLPTICYYISSHGYGHAARSRHVLARLAGRCRLIIKTGIGRDFFGDVLSEGAEFLKETVDGGLVQPANTAVDWPASVRATRERLAQGHARAAAEGAWLREKRVDLVVADIAPLGILAASEAALPNLCLANFTWFEIFREASPELAEEFRYIYSCAGGLLRTPLGFPMEYMRLQRDIDLVAGHVPCCEKELREAVEVPEDHRTVLVYLGNYGTDDLRVPTLPGVTMVGYQTGHSCIREISSEVFPAERAIASVDAVLAKPGYSTCGQCMAAGMPLVTYPRPEFAEYFPMIEQLRAWGGCVEMSAEEFEGGQWGRALERAFELKPAKAPAEGASQAAEEMLRVAMS